MVDKPLTYDEKLRAFTEGPASVGCEECPHCNGYGASLKETDTICSQCGGSGLVRLKAPTIASMPYAEVEKKIADAVVLGPRRYPK